MPESSNIVKTYVEFLSFLSQFRLKTSVAPDVISEKYGFAESGKETELNLENRSGESFKELTAKNEKYKPPIEVCSSGREAEVSIDVDIRVEREDPPAPLTPIIIITNRNPVEVIDSHKSEVAMKPAVKKKTPCLQKNMEFSIIATRDFIDFNHPRRSMSKRSIICLIIASVIYIVVCFGFMIYRRLQWSGVEMKTINMTGITPHLHILETNKTDIFDVMNENVTSNSLS